MPGTTDIADDPEALAADEEQQIAEESALWKEFDADEASTGGDPPDDDPEAADEPPPQDPDPAPPATDEPPPEPAAKKADRQPPDLWATAPPELRAEFEANLERLRRLEQSDRSNRGRVAALQRQLAESSGARRQPPAEQPPAAAEGEPRAEGFLSSDEWKSFQEEYPEVASPLSKLIGGLEGELTRHRKELSAIGDDRRQTALAEQEDHLTEEHPDWREVTSDPLIAEWLPTQPRHIREAAFRNANEIVDAEEAADVVSRFKAFRLEKNGQSQDPGAGDGRQTGNPRLTGKRQRQLESSAAARSRGPGVASGIAEDGDPEAIWKQFDEVERRQQRA